MIAIIPAAGPTAAIAGLDVSGACLVALYNRTDNAFTTLLSQNTTGICIQKFTFSAAERAVAYSGIYKSSTGATSLVVGSVSISSGANVAGDVGAYTSVDTLTAIA